MSDLIGQRIGPYHITALLGHGGMADVYRASQTNIRREVAIKVLPAHFLQDRTFLERFKREVQVIAGLQNPRILPVHDFGEQDSLPYIVMAYMPGGSLADLIRASNGGLPLEDAVRLVGQIAEGLDYAHEQGIIHRDFKPSNVLLDRKGNAHLADFGIAKVTADTAQLTGSGLVGTPTYMAPEMGGEGGITPLVDVYALGVTLFEMLTGRQPYRADTPMGVIIAHATKPVPDVRSFRPDLPAEVQAVIEAAMAKDPQARTPSAGEVAAGLRAAAEGYQPLPVEMPPPQTEVIPKPALTPTPPAVEPEGTLPIPAPPRHTARTARHGRGGLWIGLGAVALVAVIGGGLALSGALASGKPTPTPTVTTQDVNGLAETITSQAVLLAAPGQTATAAPTDTPTATITSLPTATQGAGTQPPPDTPAATKAATAQATATSKPTSTPGGAVVACPPEAVCPAGMDAVGCLAGSTAYNCRGYAGGCDPAHPNKDAECAASCAAAFGPVESATCLVSSVCYCWISH